MKKMFLFLHMIFPLAVCAQTGNAPIFSNDQGIIAINSQYIDQPYNSVNSLSYNLVNTHIVTVGNANYTISTGRFLGWDNEPGDFDVIQISRNGEQQLLYRADDGIAKINNSKNLYVSRLNQYSLNGYFFEILLDASSKALIFLGQHYGTDLSRLIIFILSDTDVKLVYNKRMAIDSINIASDNFSMTLESEIIEQYCGVSPVYTIFQQNNILYIKDN